ncbi:LOW QUALITY PROTEIN: Retrotransposon like protein [Phytophthora megakarya]|uniref:Retrotransposon like protein n=1 Tax=Phytophthora megakarya TaxID=4795 RepID=A0A225WE60_9STRA|nr:LOW QUALITY PROTEIN: Retrotransposon like protein [Phytophthora megakarya]
MDPHNDSAPDANDNSGNDDSDNNNHFWPPSPKRPRSDEDSLLGETVLAYAADVDDADDAPTTYQLAIQNNESSQCVKAMNAELKAHSHGRYFGAQRVLVQSVVVGYSSRNEMNVAELCSFGFKQKFGVDFFKPYSPVANMNSIRVVLSVVVAEGYVTERLAANTAFVNSDLKERVYMEVPYDINNTKNVTGQSDISLETDSECLTQDGPPSIRQNWVSELRYLYVCLYVDAMIIAAKTGEEIQEV